MMNWYGYNGYIPIGNIFTFLGPIFMILFWIIIIILIIYIARGDLRIFQKQSGHNGEFSMDILQKRYAKGEITKKEFDEIKKDLM